MHIVGVHRLTDGPVVTLDVPHGHDPRQLLWQSGWTVAQWLSATGTDDDIVLTARVRRRSPAARMPRHRVRKVDPDLVILPGEVPQPRQRVAAYGIVRSQRGVLGTVCSDLTAVPGRWQLPGGGVEQHETPSEAVIREIREETNQHVKLLRVVDLQSDHWIGRAPNGTLEDFQALRIIYTALCLEPTRPKVLDVGGTTQAARWVSLRRWRSLPWTSSARSALDKYLGTIRDPRLDARR